MKRIKYLIIIIILIGAAFLVSSIFSSQNKSDLRNVAKKSVDKLVTLIVKNGNYKFPIVSSGRMFAFNKIELYAEVGGILEPGTDIFKSGTAFRKGETLVKINSDVYYNSLLSTKSNLLNQLTIFLSDLKSESSKYYSVWLKYLEKFDLYKPLNDLPGNLNQRQMIFLASHNILNLFYQVKGMEATFDKYTIVAPFDGVVTVSNINQGTLVRNGQKLGEFVNSSLYEMEVPLKISDLKKVFVGKSIELVSLSGEKIEDAKIARINTSVDQQTQSVKVYIQSSNKNIIDGMYFNVNIFTNSNQKLTQLPLSAINENSEVRIKSGSKIKYQTVTIVEKTLTNYFVEGLKDNLVIVVNNSTK